MSGFNLFSNILPVGHLCFFMVSPFFSCGLAGNHGAIKILLRAFKLHVSTAVVIYSLA